MSKIAIIGGHGKIALQAARILADRGDEVTSIIRNPEQRDDVIASGATPAVADVEQLDTAAIAKALTGHDVIVWSAGAGGGDPARTYAVDRDAAIRSVDAAELAGVRRYIMVSYFGAGPDHGVPEDNSFFHYAESKAAADTHLKNSGLDWTILGPSGLTDDAPGGIETGPEVEKSTVSRGTVAQVIAATVADPSTVGRVIEFNDGSKPVAEALS